MSEPVFITWLWNSQGGWRHNAGYTPDIIAGVQHMLRKAVPEARHVCICDEEYRVPLIERGIDFCILWDVFGAKRTARHGFDCHARLGLYGTPGLELAEYLGTDQVQWIDADVMVRPSARAALLDRWDSEPEMYWVPRQIGKLEPIFKFGANTDTWLGVNGSMVRLRLGSRPDWWKALQSREWIAETEAKICGSDQAALTRLLLEERGEEWRVPNDAIFKVTRFGDKVTPWGLPGAWEVAFFPYDPLTPEGRPTDYTKPWLTENAYLRREWRVLAGMATEAEQRAEENPALRRLLRRP